MVMLIPALCLEIGTVKSVCTLRKDVAIVKLICALSVDMPYVRRVRRKA